MTDLSVTKLAFIGMVDARLSSFLPFVVNGDGTGLRRVGNNEQPNFSIDFENFGWSRDGLSVIYSACGQIFQESILDGSVSVLTAQSEEIDVLDGPWNSPDRKYVALAIDDDDDDLGFVLLENSTGIEKLCAENLACVHDFNWLPDSSALTFSAGSVERPDDLWLYEISTESLVRLSKGTGAEPVIAWSPDLSKVVVNRITKDETWCDGFVLRSRDGHMDRRLVDQMEETGEIRMTQPVWSPDGKFFALSVILSPDDLDYTFQIYTEQGDPVVSVSWPGENLHGIFELAWQPSDF